MRGKVAKRLRRAIFGSDFSPRARKYSVAGRHGFRVVADQLRRNYQALKRSYLRGEIKL